jgi:putative membrane protein
VAGRLTTVVARAGRVDSAFSSEDLAAIDRAVREAEARSPGEIVPYAVDRSDPYAEGTWAASALGALLGPLVAAGLSRALEPWGHDPVLWLLAPATVGAAAGHVLGLLWPAARVRLVPAHTLEHRVHQRATAAFVEQEVFRTRARTGILLFLSLLERRVVVLADAGINARVSQSEWDAVAAGIVAGMRRGEPGPALASAIRRCGELLAAHGFPRTPDDRDELPDDLRRRRE